jgi:hypothetical protein
MPADYSAAAFFSSRSIRICSRQQTHCAAQAEYGRLAAQAYSPSDAISQAGICRGGVQKVQRLNSQILGQIRMPKRNACRHRTFIDGAVVLRIGPAVGDPVRMAPCGGVVLRGKRDLARDSAGRFQRLDLDVGGRISQPKV